LSALLVGFALGSSFKIVKIAGDVSISGTENAGEATESCVTITLTVFCPATS
jgi:hypothetical protein